jgi:hypothetical protein
MSQSADFARSCQRNSYTYLSQNRTKESGGRLVITLPVIFRNDALFDFGGSHFVGERIEEMAGAQSMQRPDHSYR